MKRKKTISLMRYSQGVKCPTNFRLAVSICLKFKSLFLMKTHIILDTGQRILVINSWKDEGFRKQKNADIDWKEQISFRILQEDSQTQEKTLLYQGSKLSPSQPLLMINGFYLIKDMTECYVVFI
jgi:hypothetical protein